MKTIVAWLADKRQLPQVTVNNQASPAFQPIRVTDLQNRIFFWIAVVLAPSLLIAAGIAGILLQRLRH